MATEKLVDLSRVAQCKQCAESVVWLRSKRTGKAYPVNYGGDVIDGQASVKVNDFHQCKFRK